MLGIWLSGCAQTEIIESPQTGFASTVGEAKEPTLLWTSRTLSTPFDYLGQIKVRDWSYDSALDRLSAAAKELHADAVTDIHYETVGFFTTFQAFAIKYK